MVGSGELAGERTYWIPSSGYDDLRTSRLAIEHLNGSGARSEEEEMSTIALSQKP
jgi:hypothetical protein